MSKLSSRVYGRDNNFTLIRIAAASLVLFSHSFLLAPGGPYAEPWRATLGLSIGSFAVDVFFVTSGLLVTASLSRSQSIVEFAAARFFRIWPALLAVLFLTVFVLGPVCTSLPLHDYFFQHQTWGYLAHNATLLGDTRLVLPGVFEVWHKPEVNVSLWTLPYEVRCYAGLLLLWVAAPTRRFFHGAVIALFAVLLALHVGSLGDHTVEYSPFRLYCLFAAGCALFVMSSYIELSAVLGLVFLSAVLMSSLSREIFAWVYTLAIPYLVVCSAYIVDGGLRVYNRLGDYSYGVYIFGWPVQQIVVSLCPHLTPLQVFAVAMPVTVGIAVCSWRFVERPSIQFGTRWVARLRMPRPSAAAAASAVAAATSGLSSRRADAG
jgi:peptidoglycan/LPS O-acetylase OafA/YrhL